MSLFAHISQVSFWSINMLSICNVSMQNLWHHSAYFLHPSANKFILPLSHYFDHLSSVITPNIHSLATFHPSDSFVHPLCWHVYSSCSLKIFCSHTMYSPSSLIAFLSATMPTQIFPCSNCQFCPPFLMMTCQFSIFPQPILFLCFIATSILYLHPAYLV